MPARVLNLIAIVDREWKGEVQNRLERVGRFHASRTILLAYEAGRTRLDAQARMYGDHDPKPGEIVPLEERIEIDVGPRHMRRIQTLVDPLIVPDLMTLVWSPHQHDDEVDALLGLAQVVLIDTVTSPEPGSALRRSAALADDAYVVDLAWVRSMPWRERIAATFDPPEWRDMLEFDLVDDDPPPRRLDDQRRPADGLARHAARLGHAGTAALDDVDRAGDEGR